MKIQILLLSLVAFAQSLTAQNVVGRWKTIDDETGKARSIVEISVKNGVLTGKIVELFREPSEEQDPYCKLCPDDRKDKRVLGMEIIRGMKQDDEEWTDGTILDPKKGSVYDCTLWVDEKDSNKLQVRGYWGFFFRTQTWVRAK